MVFAPGIEVFRRRRRGAAALGGLREVGVSGHEVVQRLPVDPESSGGLFGGQVMGQIDGPTITDQSSSTTGGAVNERGTSRNRVEPAWWDRVACIHCPCEGFGDTCKRRSEE